MKQKITIGGEVFEYSINFRKSYKLSKYRSLLTKGSTNIAAMPKKVRDEIMALQSKGEITAEDMANLSPETLEILQSKSQGIFDNITDEDVIDMLKILLEGVEEEKILELLDKEVEISGFDKTIMIVVEAVKEVFTNAKDTSDQKEISKQELCQVANNKN